MTKKFCLHIIKEVFQVHGFYAKLMQHPKYIRAAKVTLADISVVHYKSNILNPDHPGKNF